MKYLLVALAVTALVVSAELDGTSTLDAFLEDDISMDVGQGAAAGKKNIGLNLKFKCGGWHHKIQCTISCVEEFDTPRWIWNATDVGGLGGMRHWEYVKEEGYVSRCNLKALLGPECVKHVRACFLKKWGRQCPFADARTPVQLRVLQNRFLLRTGQTGNAANDVLSVQGMNRHRWNMILTNRPGSPFSTNIQNRDRNQGRVGRGRGGGGGRGRPKPGGCPSGWMAVKNLCYSPSVTGRTTCTSTDCAAVTKMCTDQGARLPSKNELHDWLRAGGKRSSTYGVTATRSGSRRWLLNGNGDYGWFAWTCCDHPTRYHVCVKAPAPALDLDAQELNDADMLPPARHMAEGELRMWKEAQRANGNFIYHKCPSHHKVKAAAGAKKHEAELDTDLQLEDSALYGGGTCA